jgi:RNA polymerase sigma factor (sigma-70 family)
MARDRGYQAHREAGARFTALFEETYRDILAYALRRTSTRPDAEDVVAGTYLVAWRRLEEALATEAPLAWLYGVARRTLANQRRGQRRASALRQRLQSDSSPAAPDRTHDLVEVRDEVADVLRALDTLKERDQEVLRLAAFEGLTPAEIGSVLGVSGSRARTYLYRARRRLQEALDAQRRVDTGEEP